MYCNLAKLLLFALSLATIPLATAQFQLDAQLRTRGEFRDGYQRLAANDATPAALISQRSRLTLSYATEDFKLWFSPQDVRIWGDEELASLGGVTGNKASLDMFEGMVDFRIGSNSWLAVGR